MSRLTSLRACTAPKLLDMPCRLSREPSMCWWVSVSPTVAVSLTVWTLADAVLSAVGGEDPCADLRRRHRAVLDHCRLHVGRRDPLGDEEHRRHLDAGRRVLCRTVGQPGGRGLTRSEVDSQSSRRLRFE